MHSALLWPLCMDVIQLTNALNPGLGCLRLREAGRPDVEMLEDRLINWFGKNHGDDPQC